MRVNPPSLLLRPEPTWELDAFEPVISAETMVIHTTQLHQKYINNLNKVSHKYDRLLSIDPSLVLSNLSHYLDENEKEYYLNNMGGALAHTLFWYCLSPSPRVSVSEIHKTHFGKAYNLQKESFIALIKEAAENRIGSGWVWGALDSDNKLRIYSTLNHATPYMRKQTPIFCIDFWEHAYFLDTHANKSQWIDNALMFLDLSKIDIIFKNLCNDINLLDSFVKNGSYDMPRAGANAR